MTNKSTKRHHAEYQDPFEIHKLQSEANIKRMKMEKRLNVINGNAMNSGTTPVTLKTPEVFRKRRPLSDMTTTVCNNNSNKHTNEKSIGKPKVTISNMRNSIIAMHRKSSVPKISIPKSPMSNTNKISIFELSSIIKNTKFTKYVKHGFNNRYLEISNNILAYIPFENTNANNQRDNLLLQTHRYLKTFIEWFKVNKFDYLFVDKKLATLRKKAEEHTSTSIPIENSLVKNKQKEGIVQKLSRQRYIRNEYRQNVANPNPTHIVQTSSKVGKFMTTAKVKNIISNKSVIVLLLRTDTRFVVNTNDMLVLMDKSCHKQIINNKETPVYVNWHIYKEEPIDIDFFN